MELNIAFSSKYNFYCQFDDNDLEQCISPWVISHVTAGQHQITFWDIKTRGEECFRDYTVTVKSK